MNCSKLIELIDGIKSSGVDFDRMNADDITDIRKFCDQKQSIIWLSDHSRLTSVYMNETGRKYFGLEHRNMADFHFGAILELTHPEDLHIFRASMRHFSLDPEKPYNMCVRMRAASGSWKWVYMAQAALTFSMSGLPEYMAAYMCDVEELVSRSAMNGSRQLHIEKKSRYDSLTMREKEILELVAAEMTSQEIADHLYIETSTVDTHRKNIIRKLRVKSSLGLVQYALFYSGAQPAYRRVP